MDGYWLLWLLLLVVCLLFWALSGNVARWTLRVLGLAVLFGGLLWVGATETREETAAAGCRVADRALQADDVEKAEAAYLAVLHPDADPPETEYGGSYLDASRIKSSECVRIGLLAVLRAEADDDSHCRGADRLRAAGREGAAEASYLGLLRNADGADDECAHMGLDALAATDDDTPQQTYDDHVVERGEDVVGRMLEVLSDDRVDPPGPVTWAVVLVALVLGWRWLEIRNAERDLMVVTVADVGEPVAPVTPPTADPGQQPAATGKEAGGLPAPAVGLRHRLNRAGLIVPGSVPGAPPAIESLVADSPFGESWIARVITFLVQLGLPVRGVRLTATPIVRPRSSDGYGFAIEVTRLRNADMVILDTFWGASYEDALDRAAYGVAQQLMARCRSLPPWSYWGHRDGEALYHYQRGLAEMTAPLSVSTVAGCGRPDLEDAEAELLMAAGAVPSNAAVKTELAKVAEQREDFLPAIERYLDVVRQHPRAVIARYRLAFNFAMVERWVAAWECQPDVRRRVQSALAAVQEKLSTPNGEVLADDADRATIVKHFFDLAGAHLEALDDDIRRRTLLRWSWDRRYRRIYLSYVTPGRDRRRLVQGVEGSRLAVELRREARKRQEACEVEQEPGHDPRKDQVDRLAGDAEGYEAHYNAACCYALLMTRPPCLPTFRRSWEERNDEYAAAAVVQLQHTVDDVDMPFPTSARPWVVSGDPDLATLRPHRRFRDWVVATFGSVDTPDLRDRRAKLARHWATLDEVLDALTMSPSLASDLEGDNLRERELARWDALRTWVASPCSGCAQQQMVAAFPRAEGTMFADDGSAEGDASAEDHRKREERWLWLVSLATELHAMWTRTTADQPYAGETIVGLWLGLRSVAADPTDDEVHDTFVETVATFLAPSGADAPPLQPVTAV